MAEAGREMVVGIDFGSADSYVGYIASGAVDIAQNEVSQRKTPSLVAFTEKERLLGDGALSLIKSNAKNTCRNFKHLLGQRFDSPGVAEERFWSPAALVEGEDGLAAFQANYRGESCKFSAVAVTAMFLTKLRDLAEAWRPGEQVADAVVAVPSFFADAQRTALLDASKVAGVNVIRVMNEHTAIALSYGFYRFHNAEADKLSTVAFCSMGHTVFSVAIVQFTRGKMTVICERSAKVGGRDMDECLMRNFAKEFEKKVGSDPLSNKKAVVKLEDAVAKTKKILSANSEASISVECLLEDEDFSSQIDRAKFLEMCAPMMRKVSDVLEAAKAMAGPHLDAVEAVEMIGGASRVPWVKEMCSKAFGGKELSSTLNADECVARGCTLQAALLSPLFKVKSYHVEDTVAFPVVLGWQFPATAPSATEPPSQEAERTALIFPENSLTNIYKVVTFFRRETFQLRAMYATDAALPEGTPRELGTYKVELPTQPEPRKVKVKAALTLHGTFSIEGAQLLEEDTENGQSAAASPDAAAAAETGEAAANGGSAEGAGSENELKREASGGAGDGPKEPPRKRSRRTDLVVTPSGRPGLSEADLERRRADETTMREQMAEVVETGARRNDLEAYILGMRSGIVAGGKYGDFVTDAERESLSERLVQAEDWLYDHINDEKQVYVEKLAELRVHGDPAERRHREAQQRPDLLLELEESLKAKKAVAGELRASQQAADTQTAERLEAAIDATERWLTDLRPRQASLASHEEPVLTCAELRSKCEELSKLAQRAPQPADAGDVPMAGPSPSPPPLSPPPPSPSR